VKDRELPEDVRNLIRNSIPTLEALELFMGLARSGDHAWTLGEVASLPAAEGLSPSAVANFLTTLEEQGFLHQTQPGHYRYQSESPEATTAVQGLIRAYDERPVTLIRTVYAIADSRRIQGFADAFRIKPKRDS